MHEMALQTILQTMIPTLLEPTPLSMTNYPHMTSAQWCESVLSSARVTCCHGGPADSVHADFSRDYSEWIARTKSGEKKPIIWRNQGSCQPLTMASRWNSKKKRHRSVLVFVVISHNRHMRFLDFEYRTKCDLNRCSVISTMLGHDPSVSDLWVQIG